MVQAKFWLRPCRAQRVHQVVDCDRSLVLTIYHVNFRWLRFQTALVGINGRSLFLHLPNCYSD
ncbi:MAG: hypothetical protein HWQ38_33590 [Nostoc sp. NMS7]|uniref:hypothetical protein n=1 Tax=Nostoc sp. NMS7 TaxID=2815391 RepID=UPI0025FF362E|nr:hypothetical protein [Nostoc sp. NMS7]MBN3951139.1 hypothetical protein [Nostoc sp. NMS7]